jgi:hypothetical protein
MSDVVIRAAGGKMVPDWVMNARVSLIPRHPLVPSICTSSF